MPRARIHRPSYAQGFARCAAESANPGLWMGLLGVWAPFLGSSGLKLHDWSGHRRNGTLVTMDPATDWVPTEKGWALDFDGGDDHVTWGDAAWMDVPRITVAGLINFRAAGWDYLITRDDGGSRIFDLGKDGNERVVWFAWDSGSNIFDATGTILSLNRWYHLAWTYDGVTGRAYLDGKEDGTDTSTTAALQTGTAPLYLARQIGTYNNCQIACAGMWNRSLSAREIRFLAGDPYALLRQRVRPKYVAAAAGSVNLLQGLIGLPRRKVG